ncbi:MAG: hypothetical protein H7Z74_01005 [Anaerolineae bacterium]|nr:hypothetical protein [Gemmatimonadaceae bacterium]
MTAKTAALVLFLASSATAIEAQNFAYAPAVVKYRITSIGQVSQEMMGQKRQDSLNSNMLVSLNISAKGKDTLHLMYVIDSASSTNPTLAAQISKVVGDTIRSFISPIGQVFSFLPPADSAEGAGQQYQEFRTFLIRFPSASPKAGVSWVDTTTTPFNNQGIEGSATVVTASKILGDTTYGGEKAWRVERKSSVTLNGSGTAQGQAMVLEGTGTADEMRYISSKGLVLGATGKENSDINVSIPAMNATIPITRSSTSKIELIRGK